MYYNYHAKAKRLIREGHLVKFETVKEHNGITPALILYFDNHGPIPIRKEKWAEYSQIITNSTNFSMQF